MSDGIRINDAGIEISPEGLQALVNKQGAALRITKLDLSASPDALNTLLAGLTPEGQTPPTVEVSDGRLQFSARCDDKSVALDLQAAGLRLEFTADGLRLVTG